MSSRQKPSSGENQSSSNGIKLKSANTKIAAYDIDFFGMDRQKREPATQQPEAPMKQQSPTSSQGKNNDTFSQNTIEAFTTEILHQDMLIDCKSHNLAIITESMEGFSKAVSMEPSGHNMFFNNNSNTITCKSKHFVLTSFLLLFFTLLPLQYHNQNFLIQVKKMQDSCMESKGFFHENQSYILDTIFPYGFSSGLEFDTLNRQLNVLNQIQQSRSLNNYTLKSMRQLDCIQNNMTSFLNIITVPPAAEFQVATTTPPAPFIVDSFFVSSLKIKQKKHEHNARVQAQNLILICDDEFHDKSVARAIGSRSHISDPYYFDDVKANVLTQWNISCKSLSTTTATISYSQMTFLSGQILGAIFFSMLSDYLGRKRVYLITLYSSTIIGSVASIVQTYKQFVFVRFPIAAITQGCYIMSYVLLFEIILSSNKRHIYCTIFVACQFFWNIFISISSRFFQDWRYMQLSGSLLASLAVGYPWLIKESFKWLIVRDDFSQAERVCRKIFKERNIVARLMKMKLDDQTISHEYDSDGYWPVVIWQPTFRKIISFFVLIWSIVSLISFFINEESKKLLSNNINDYSLQNGILFLTNAGLGFVYYSKLGKRFPLGICMVLGSVSYLVFSLTEDLTAEWLRVILLQFAKIFISCAFNILMLYVCELFPCEIRCSSFSFFISIKHLSEMFAIYIFKMNYSSMITIRVSLSICCLIMSLFAFLLPERSAFSFNLDYKEYLNRYSMCKLNSLTPPPYNKYIYGIGSADESISHNSKGNTNAQSYLDLASLKEWRSNNAVSGIQNMKMPGKTGMFVSDLDDCETYILANSLIKKINCENHCKTGKLNPLYEEDASVLSNNFIGLPSSHNQNVIFSKVIAPQNNSLSMFSKINTKPSTTGSNASSINDKANSSQRKHQSVQQSSTKF